MFIFMVGCTPADDVPLSPSEAATDGGDYTLGLVANPAPYLAGEVSELTVTVRDAAGLVDGATLELIPWMPAHDHGITEDPTVEDLGAGVLVAAWTFTMAGYWEIDLVIDAATGSDSVTIGYEVD